MGMLIINGKNYSGSGSGIDDYEGLNNLPSINNITLLGDLSFSDLGLGDIVTKNIDNVISQNSQSENIPTSKAVSDALNIINSSLSSEINTFYDSVNSRLFSNYILANQFIENGMALENKYALQANLSAVAFSGSYNDLFNTPSIATISDNGFMSSTDKAKLDGIATNAQVNVIETVKVNGTALTPSSKAVDITVPTSAADIGAAEGNEYGVAKKAEVSLKLGSDDSGYFDGWDIYTIKDDISELNSGLSTTAATASSATSAANQALSGLASKQDASTAITTSNIGSQSVNYANSAGNADTIDGYHADSLIRTDNIAYQNVSSADYIRTLGNQEILTGRATFGRNGAYTYNSYGATGAPSTFMSYISFGNNNGGGTGEIGIEWTSAAGMWYRSQGDWQDWTGWKQVIDSSNIGSQSVNYANSAGSATDSTKLPLSGGTMTGSIITPADDSKGIIPATNNYGQIGSSSSRFFRMYATYFYAQDTTLTSGALKTTHNGGWLNLCANQAVQCRNYDDSGWVVINASGFANQSSLRYKTNIKNIELEEAKKLLELRVVSYDYIDGVRQKDREKLNQHGLIAEEVESIIPEVVYLKDINGEIVPDSIDYSKFTPYLIKMIQYLSNELASLKPKETNESTV